MPNVKSIVQEPHKALRTKAREVSRDEITSPRIRGLISGMKEVLKTTPDGVGLAAPQVGELLRLFLVSDEAEEIDRVGHLRRDSEGILSEKLYPEREWKYYVFVNPIVKNTSRKKLEDTEGCLSVRGKYGVVKRHEKITVEAYDEHGKKFTRGASKFFARVLQHELDHLEGILFIDKASEILKR